MSTVRKLTRRAFLISTGLAGMTAGGLLLSGKMPALQDRLHSLLQNPPEKLRLFIRIGTDNRVTLVCHRVEMGQGVRTALPMILADELEADWSLVDVIQAPGDSVYGNQYTAGSRSIATCYALMRELGATARLLLEQAAALIWRVPVSECNARSHQVVHAPSGRALAFGELAELASTLPIPEMGQVTLKAAHDFRYIGKATSPVDNPEIVTGQSRYASDMQLPGMLYAVVEHAPVIGAQLIRLDVDEARGIAGVTDIFVLPVQSFPMGFKPLHGVAVVATNTWAALKARQKLKCEWSTSPYSTRGSAALQSDLGERIKNSGEIVHQIGNAPEALTQSSQTIEATYFLPYLAHTPMEPPAAVADASWNSCRLWVSSQDPLNVRYEIAALLNLPLHKVEVNVPLLGGGFGRKAKGDFCAQAALISAQVGKPVKLFWSREDDIRFGYYHAMSVMHMTAGIDTKRQPTGLILRAAYPSIASLYTEGANKPRPGEVEYGINCCLFSVPNQQAEVHSADEAARIGWFRSVTAIQYAFANNCFADELASLRGLSPLENLLSLIGPDRVIAPGELKMDVYIKDSQGIDTSRLKRVLQTVADASRDSTQEANTGWGYAVYYGFPTATAAATKVRVEDGTLNIEEVHIAIDCGRVVNPESVKAQLEGSVIFALSFTLEHRIDILHGQVAQRNFHDYPLLRINQCPKITTYLMASDLPPSGVGEPAVPVIAPSVVNALFAATGTRIRTLPLNQFFKV